MLVMALEQNKRLYRLDISEGIGSVLYRVWDQRCTGSPISTGDFYENYSYIDIQYH